MAFYKKRENATAEERARSAQTNTHKTNTKKKETKALPSCEEMIKGKWMIQSD